MHKVVVIGGAHHNTLGVVRSLGEGGVSRESIYLISIGKGRNFVSSSKYLQKKNIHMVANAAGIKNTLLLIAEKLETKATIICCGDPFIYEVDNIRNILSDYYVIPYSTNGILNPYLNKEVQVQCKLAEKCGLNVPEHVEKKILDVDNIHLPCIVKSIDSIEGNKSDIKICFSVHELNKLDKNRVFHIERYIEKCIEYQLIGCSLENEIIIPGYTNIIRQPENTNTGYLKYSPIQDGTISEDLLKKVYRFINEIGYKGLFSVEFIRDINGKDYFLEINLRNDGNAYCVKAAGVNLPYIWYKYAGTTDKVVEKTSFDKSIYWMPELQDIRNIKKVGIIKWIKECFSAEAHAIFQLNDIAPFFAKMYSKFV